MEMLDEWRGSRPSPASFSSTVPSDPSPNAAPLEFERPLPSTVQWTPTEESFPEAVSTSIRRAAEVQSIRGPGALEANSDGSRVFAMLEHWRAGRQVPRF